VVGGVQRGNEAEDDPPAVRRAASSSSSSLRCHLYIMPSYIHFNIPIRNIPRGMTTHCRRYLYPVMHAFEWMKLLANEMHAIAKAQYSGCGGLRWSSAGRVTIQ
jgi:hypothetical protein